MSLNAGKYKILKILIFSIFLYFPYFSRKYENMKIDIMLCRLRRNAVKWTLVNFLLMECRPGRRKATDTAARYSSWTKAQGLSPCACGMSTRSNTETLWWLASRFCALARRFSCEAPSRAQPASLLYFSICPSLHLFISPSLHHSISPSLLLSFSLFLHILY